MYEITNDQLSRTPMVRELIPFATALVVGEVFYKLGSFTLEAVAFLATWYGLSSVSALLSHRRNRDESSE